MNTKEWFKSKGLEARNYQIDILDNQLPEKLYKESLPTVLAASPSSGKTIMSIKAIEDYLSKFPDARVLVLAHGTTILRTQFYDTLKDIKPSFTYRNLESGSDILNCTEQVIISLPHAFEKITKLGDFDLLVVDEAHEFYNASMVKTIIRKTKPKHQLLLTGTPSWFISSDYPIIAVTVNELLEVGAISDIIVETVTSDYSYTSTDYNSLDELKTDVKISEQQTINTLDNVLDSMLKRLNSKLKNNPVAYSKIKTNLNYSIGFGELKKTMIACKNIEQADQVAKHLRTKGIDVALSHSEIDIDSNQITRFTEDKDCLVLVVVYRGILGFNYPELVNVIDMSLSHNVNRIFQLMTRTIRKHPNGEQKIFFKVATATLSVYFKHIMTCVLCLTDREYYLKFNGRNFLDMEIPIKPCSEGKKPKEKKNNPTQPKIKQTVRPIEIDGVPSIKFFKDLIHKDNGLFDGTGYVKMREVKQIFYNLSDNKHSGYWTFEKCQLEALKYKTRNEFAKGSQTTYVIAHRNGWLDKICKHMKGNIQNTKNHWNFENCQLEALKWNSKFEFQKGSGGAYKKALKNGWLDKICKHMKGNVQWIKKMVIEKSMKCKTRNEFLEKYPNEHSAAKRNGWLDDAYKHMKEKFNHTFEKCQLEALKYNTRTKFAKDSGNYYNAARNNGWLDETCKHMVSGNNKLPRKWTKEKCQLEAKKYDSKSEFAKYSGGAYNAARRYGWLDEICKHMK